MRYNVNGAAIVSLIRQNDCMIRVSQRSLLLSNHRRWNLCTTIWNICDSINGKTRLLSLYSSFPLTVSELFAFHPSTGGFLYTFRTLCKFRVCRKILLLTALPSVIPRFSDFLVLWLLPFYQISFGIFSFSAPFFHRTHVIILKEVKMWEEKKNHVFHIRQRLFQRYAGWIKKWARSKLTGNRLIHSGSIFLINIKKALTRLPWISSQSYTHIFRWCEALSRIMSLLALPPSVHTRTNHRKS